MWTNFDGKPYTREQLKTHIDSLDFSNWRRKDGTRGRPLYIVFHNTSEPTIEQWMGWSVQKRQDYIHNVQQYYENDLGWRAGPHYFVPPTIDPCCFGFSNPVTAGTHCSCFNSDSIGIEHVGEFNIEQYDSGPGAIVRDNGIYLMALLHNKLGLEPAPYSYGVRGLHFHIECAHDNHDCPGKNVHKPDVVARIQAEMALLKGAPSPAPFPSSFWQKEITATVFGGDDEEERSAYDNHRITETELAVALPAKFEGKRPKVVVQNASTGQIAIGSIEDLGPWNTNDPYWKTNSRPQAESGTDKRGRRTNLAGIDLSPGLARAVGIDGMGKVNWRFEDQNV